jgi:beta-amylase
MSKSNYIFSGPLAHLEGVNVAVNGCPRRFQFRRLGLRREHGSVLWSGRPLVRVPRDFVGNSSSFVAFSASNGVNSHDGGDRDSLGTGLSSKPLSSQSNFDYPSTPRKGVQSGFIKPDAELKGLLQRISDDKDVVMNEIKIHQMVEEGHNEYDGWLLNVKEEKKPLLKAPVRGFPVYVMLPLDTVWLVETTVEEQDEMAGGRDNVDGVHHLKSVLMRENGIDVGLEMLQASGVEGVMVDVWWGIVEHQGPKKYDFMAYRALFEKILSKGLKVQAVMSFHAAGGNVGDTCTIPLPAWVYDAADMDPDIFYTDAGGYRNPEYISLGCDDVPCLFGRTPVEAYTDFITAFADEFYDLMGHTITEITVGLGPAGELRYPSYPEGDGRWRFPGVGQFQCFDKYMLQRLQNAAKSIGRPEWGHGGPHDAGHYNSREWETGFFRNDGGSYLSEYGKFFLTWYSDELIQHADRILGASRTVLSQHGRPRDITSVREASDGGSLYVFEPAAKLSIKLAGVHWWFKSRAHAAELTAGYYNTRERDGYIPIMKMLAKNDVGVSFTCVEMRDCEHPREGLCSPEGLLNQVLSAASMFNVSVAGENALQRYDGNAFDKIAESTFGQSAMAGRMDRLTFLRMGDMMVDNWDAFAAFIKRLSRPPDHWRQQRRSSHLQYNYYMIHRSRGQRQLPRSSTRNASE